MSFFLICCDFPPWKQGVCIHEIDRCGIFITFSLKSELHLGLIPSFIWLRPYEVDFYHFHLGFPNCYDPLPWKRGVYIKGIDRFGIFLTFSLKSDPPPWKQGVYKHGIDGFGIFITFSLKSEPLPWKQGVYTQGIDGIGIFITFSLKSEFPPWKQGVYIKGIDRIRIFLTFSLKSELPSWKQDELIQGIDDLGIFLTFSLKSDYPPWKQGEYIQGIDGFGIFITFSLKSEHAPWKQGVYIHGIDGYILFSFIEDGDVLKNLLRFFGMEDNWKALLKMFLENFDVLKRGFDGKCSKKLVFLVRIGWTLDIDIFFGGYRKEDCKNWKIVNREDDSVAIFSIILSLYIYENKEKREERRKKIAIVDIIGNWNVDTIYIFLWNFWGIFVHGNCVIFSIWMWSIHRDCIYEDWEKRCWVKIN
ncbi:hypothetical protein Lser_V15G05855 [Lactuca serriola]